MALATAGLSAAWALRPRHALAAAGWIVLSLASVIGHWMVPPAMDGEGEPAASAAVVDRLNRMAYSLEPLTEDRVTPEGDPGPPALPSLWSAEMIGHISAADSSQVLAIDAAIVPVRGQPRPVWLVVRVTTSGRASVRPSPTTGPEARDSRSSIRPSDTCRDPSAANIWSSGRRACIPTRRSTGSSRPIDEACEVGGWARRLMLAWALQAGGLLRHVRAADQGGLAALARGSVWRRWRRSPAGVSPRRAS